MEREKPGSMPFFGVYTMRRWNLQSRISGYLSFGGYLL